MTYWVYILASRKHGTLYVGVTNSLERRIAEHRARETPGFTKTYGVDRLVFYQGYGEAMSAIGFEKAPEALATRLENPPDRRGQSPLGRSLSPEYRAPR